MSTKTKHWLLVIYASNWAPQGQINRAICAEKLTELYMEYIAFIEKEQRFSIKKMVDILIATEQVYTTIERKYEAKVNHGPVQMGSFLNSKSIEWRARSWWSFNELQKVYDILKMNKNPFG